jgi:hypothetical protein
MHVKYACLHCSYAAPVFVSVFWVVCVVAAALETTRVFLSVFVFAYTDVLVAFGTNTVTGFEARADTVVFTALREVFVLVLVGVIETVFVLLRDGEFAVRTADSAPVMQNKEPTIKNRIFFISF